MISPVMEPNLKHIELIQQNLHNLTSSWKIFTALLN